MAIVISIDTVMPEPLTEAQLLEQVKQHFKGLYLNVVNEKLREHDYDSLDTVKLWADDATFGTEATAILNWYKSVIAYNYGLLNAGTVVPTDAEYLAGMPELVV